MPNETVVTVRGSWTSRHAPELATVQLAVAHEGPDKAEVYRRAVEAANGLVGTVRAMAGTPDSPVSRWSSDRLHSWFDRPWDEHGRQLAPVHHAHVRVRVTFRDLDASAAFLDDVGARAAVSVENVSWALSEEHSREFSREARRRAVDDAAERARDYAEAAGFASVAFVAIADVGLLDDDGARPRAVKAQGLGFHMGASTMDAGGAPDLSPEDIVVAATVEARFLAT